MKIEVNGVRYQDFTTASAVLRLDVLSNTFSFDATRDVSSGGPSIAIKGGDSCRIYADDELILTGNVEVLDVAVDEKTHTINLQGRDRTGDFLDSSIGNLGDLKPPISLRRFLETIAAHIGTDVEVIDEVRPALFQESVDLPSPEPGENAFAVAEKFARKRGVLLSSNADGNIVIARASGVDSGATLQSRYGDPDHGNNVISQNFTYDETGRFNVYRTAAQMDALAAMLAGNTADSITDQNGIPIRDEQIRRGRQMVLVAEAPSSKDDATERSQWEANIRRARGRTYSAVVDGFRNDQGDLWQPNRLVTVNDEFAGISAKMLINSAEFRMDGSSGRTTRLDLVERNAYTLTLEEPTQDDVGDSQLRQIQEAARRAAESENA